MRIKDVEKRIVEGLTFGEKLPNPHMLDKAKKELSKNKKQARVPKLKLALTLFFSLAVCLAVVLPVAFYEQPQDEPAQYFYTAEPYTSMQVFNASNGLPVNSFTQQGGIAESDSYSFLNGINSTLCRLIKKNGNDEVCIQENYDVENGDKIETYIVLTDDAETKQDFFAEFSALTSELKVLETDILYSFDDAKETARVSFCVKGYSIYMKFSVPDKQRLYLYLEYFLALQ